MGTQPVGFTVQSFRNARVDLLGVDIAGPGGGWGVACHKRGLGYGRDTEPVEQNA